jgi:glycosyltransferase involved in cell wall biosynthesis
MQVGIVSFTDVDSGLDLANAIAEAGVEVTFYSSRSHTIRTVGNSEFPVEQLYKKGLLREDVRIQLTQLRRMRSLHSYSVINSLVKKIQNDGIEVVHILIGGGELWTAVLAKLLKLRRIPVVSTVIIPKPNIGEFPPPQVVIWINWLIASSSDAIIVNGKDHETIMHEVYNCPAEKVHYIPLGPRNVFLKWASWDVDEENGTILFLGRIHKHKGLEYLIKAQPMITKQIPSARVIIAGQGEDLGRCREFIVDFDRFEIHDGYINGETVAELFQKASVIVLPYLTAATSGILMTAYVFGKPVVATRVGSLPEYVKDGVTGILVEPRDERQLAEAIIRILSNPDLRHRMGEDAMQWIQTELSWRKISAQTIAVYEKAIAFHV